MQRASLLGELAIEFFERDIPGRRRALDEQAALLATLPIEQRAWLTRSPGSFRYAYSSYAELRERAEWLRALPRESVRPSTYSMTRILLGWLALHTHDGEGLTLASADAAAMGGRERGTLAEFTKIADEAARVGHPARAAAAISAYLRHLSGESVTEALDRLDVEEFSDDAGHSVVIAFWAEIVASLRAPNSTGPSR